VAGAAGDEGAEALLDVVAHLVLAVGLVLDEEALARLLVLDPADAGPRLAARAVGPHLGHDDVEAVAPLAGGPGGAAVQRHHVGVGRDDRRQAEQVEVGDAGVDERGVEGGQRRRAGAAGADDLDRAQAGAEGLAQVDVEVEVAALGERRHLRPSTITA
jgi:hypothetical protein